MSRGLPLSVFKILTTWSLVLAVPVAPPEVDGNLVSNDSDIINYTSSEAQDNSLLGVEVIFLEPEPHKYIHKEDAP